MVDNYIRVVMKLEGTEYVWTAFWKISCGTGSSY